MTYKEKLLFNREVDFLFGVNQLLSKEICNNQVAFADELNRIGVKLFFNKEKTLAKAYFWVAHLLGNSHAYGNLISAAI